MARVEITDNRLTVVMEGAEKFFALKGKISVPLAHVRGATADPGAMREGKGLRAPGLHLPGVAFGTFHKGGETTFWGVRDRDRAVVIELNGERYTRIIVQVVDPRATVEAVNQAVTRSRR